MQMTMELETLAEAMGTNIKDLATFILCLKVWTDKGYSLEQAIEKHLQQLARFVKHREGLSDNLRRPLADEIWTTVQRAKAEERIAAGLCI